MRPSGSPSQDELQQRIAELEAENASLRTDVEQTQKIRAIVEPLHNDAGAANADESNIEAALLEEKRTLEVLNRTGTALAAELNLERLVQIVTDAGVQLVGAAFGAFFYTSTDERGDNYMLYALSGVSREAFSKFPMPRKTMLFGQTFDGIGIVRSDDITLDPRYGHSEPHRGMPAGHLPVRSYLAVPVISRSGEVLGGLFFGHPEPGVFKERAERVIVGISAQAAIAFDNARLFQAAQLSERRFRALIEHSTDGISVIDAQNNILYLSPAVTAIEGYTPEEMIGGNGIDNTHPEDREPIQKIVRELLENPGKPIPALWRRSHKDGRWLWLEGVATNLLHDPAVRGIVTNYRDVTTRKRAEESQIRSQKMEALGTLAGGIAHDFNNILLAIAGNTRLAIADVPADHIAQQSLAEIAKAGERAASLVRRILAFSRQQEPLREVIELQPIVDEAVKLLRSTLPAKIEIKTTYRPNIPPVAADSTQIHQIIMNLATNAAHAIGEGNGTIELIVDTVLANADLISTARDLHEGLHARISVSDNGSGMDKATLERIFDPFFTTKPVGHGTGLGLSVVHGIMKNHQGAITVYSQLGKGTTFRLYFPAVAHEQAKTELAPQPTAMGNGERVLYIDDDEPIVFLTSRILKRLGYQVSGFTSPQLALDTFRAAPDGFDVIVTDLSMPGLSGFELAAEVRKLRPDISILMTSGYVRPEDREAAHSHGIRDLILKPNSVDELGQALDRMFKELRKAK